MRIAVDGRVLGHHFPGIGRQVRGLAHALPALASGHELCLVVPGGQQGDRWSALEITGLRPIPCPPTKARLPRPPRRLAREHAFDLFHATHIAAAGPLACKTVVTVYDVIPLRYPTSLPTLLHRWAYRWLLRRALLTATRVITLTEAVKRDLVDLLGVDSGKVVVTSAAVDPDLTLPTAEDIERVRRRYELPERYVFHVATQRPHKNRAGLLEAWREITGEIPSVGLVLAGSGEDRETMRKTRAKAAPGIVHLGEVAETDLWPLYAGAEVYMHPSWDEGFGLPVLEAMACGTPVCCSEIPALAEVTGEAASRFDPFDTSAMAESLAELLCSAPHRAELSLRGMERAKSFCWSRVAKKTLEAYDQALSEKERDAR